MNEYRYAIVKGDGESYLLAGDPDHAKHSLTALPALLTEGWTPVRETAEAGGTGAIPTWLVLLEREKPSS